MRARTLAAVLALLPNAASAYGQGGSMPGPTLHALGFGDVLYEATERDVAAGFRLGQVVGHLSAGLTDRLSAFGEFTATAHAADFGLGVERLIVRYDFSDRFKLSLGRYHTPISYWNTAFHHGLWLQTTVARPEMIRFGSPFLPVHFLGLLAEGSLLPGGLGLKYAAGVGNGRAADIRQPGDAGDVNDRRAWLGSLSAEPAVLGHLRLGGAVLLDRASPEPDRQADQRILSAHVVWTQESPEVIAEYARLIDEPVGADAGAVSDAYYLQLAYRLPGPARAFKPYVRGERLRAAGDDPILSPLNPGYEGILGGLRYDFSPYAALKMEGRRERFEGAPWTNSVFLQASFVVAALGGDAAPLTAGHPAPAPPPEGTDR